MSKSLEKRSYWNQIIEEYESSKQSQKYFCESRNINFSIFKYWLAQSRKNKTPKKVVASKTFFSPISLRQEKSSRGYQIKLPNGIHCSVPENFDSSEVMTLLRVLSQC